MNFTDILGSMLNQGMTPSAGKRIDNSINQGGLGDLLNSLSGGNVGGGLLGSLGKMAGAAINSGSGGGSNPVVTGGLGALVGALTGGGKGSVKGALGGTALTLIGSLALKALQGQAGASSASADSRTQQMTGLRAPEDEREADEVQSQAELIVKAMLNAAKADQSVDREELRRITGKASEDGLTREEQNFIRQELGKPLDTDSLIRAVSSPELAAQVYAASLLAIEVDTAAERSYLRELASGLGLNDEVTGQLHRALGVT